MSIDYKKHDPYVRKQNAKLTQVVQNFFSKFVQIILEARSIEPIDLESLETKLNKWFNLNTSNTSQYDSFKDEIKHWKSNNDLQSMPPMIIETYLDLRQLSPSQTVLLRDENENEWTVTKSGTKKHEIVLERWLIEFDPEDATGTLLDELPLIYKQAIVLFRVVYNYSRLMPAYKLKKQLANSPHGLNLGNKILDGKFPISSKGRIGLSKLIIPNEFLSTEHTSQKHFQPIHTTLGALKVSIAYRNHHNFIVRSNSEELLSTHFINLDSEEPKEKEKYNKRLSLSSSMSVSPHSSVREGSPSFKKSPAPRIQPFRVGSLSTSPPQLPGGQTVPSTGTLSGATLLPTGVTNVSPGQYIQHTPAHFHQQLQHSQQLQQTGSLERRISITSSKSTSNASLAALLRNPRGSTSLTTTPNIPITNTTNQYNTSSFPRSVSSSHGGEDLDSNTPRFSSSFGARASRRFSNSSIRHTTPSILDALSISAGLATSSPTSGIYIDDDISDFVRMIDSKSDLRVGGNTTQGDLSKFQLLRSQHELLGDSVSASILMSHGTGSNMGSPGGTHYGSSGSAHLGISGPHFGSSGSPANFGNSASPARFSSAQLLTSGQLPSGQYNNPMSSAYDTGSPTPGHFVSSGSGQIGTTSNHSGNSGMSRTSSRKSSHSRYSPPASLHSGSYDPHLPSISSRLREASPVESKSRTYSSSRASQEPEDRRSLPYLSHTNASFLKSSSTNKLIATPIISNAQATLHGMLSKTTVTTKKRNSGDVVGLATTPSAYERQLIEYENVFDDDDDHGDWRGYPDQQQQQRRESTNEPLGQHHEDDDDLLFTMSDMNLTKN